MDAERQQVGAVMDQDSDQHKAPRKEHTAHSMVDAGSSEDVAHGYAAVNIPASQLDQHEEIAKVAYQYFQERGGEHGSHEEDWRRAEEEVRRRNGGLGISES